MVNAFEFALGWKVPVLILFEILLSGRLCDFFFYVYKHCYSVKTQFSSDHFILDPAIKVRIWIRHTAHPVGVEGCGAEEEGAAVP